MGFLVWVCVCCVLAWGVSDARIGVWWRCVVCDRVVELTWLGGRRAGVHAVGVVLALVH